MKLKYLTLMATVTAIGLGGSLVGCSETKTETPATTESASPAATTETTKPNPCASKKANPCASKPNPCASKKP